MNLTTGTRCHTIYAKRGETTRRGEGQSHGSAIRRATALHTEHVQRCRERRHERVQSDAQMKASGEEWRREEARVVVKVVEEVEEVKMKPFDCPIGNGIVSRDISHDIQFDVHFRGKRKRGKKSQRKGRQREHHKRPVHALALCTGLLTVVLLFCSPSGNSGPFLPLFFFFFFFLSPSPPPPPPPLHLLSLSLSLFLSYPIDPSFFSASSSSSSSVAPFLSSDFSLMSSVSPLR